MLFSPQERGQGLVEYAFILVLVALVVLLVIILLGTQISGLYSKILDTFPK